MDAADKDHLLQTHELTFPFQIGVSHFHDHRIPSPLQNFHDYFIVHLPENYFL